MNVLITGGAGFLGTYVAAGLHAAGHQAFAYDLSLPTPELARVAPFLADVCISGNVLDRERLFECCRARQIDVIVHSAARVGLERSLTNPLGFYETNVMGTAAVCDVAVALGISKVVAISSNAVYQRGVHERLAETDCAFSIREASPAAHYGTSKMAAEAVGITYAQFHSLDFVALRITAIYGFGMQNPILIKPMVENAVLGCDTVLPSGGHMKRDYTHVLDCASAVRKVVMREPTVAGSQRVLNVSAGRTVSGFELAALVKAALPGARIEIDSELSQAEQAALKDRPPFDIAAAKRVLQWQPAWPIGQGIREYADRFRDYVKATN